MFSTSINWEQFPYLGSRDRATKFKKRLLIRSSISVPCIAATHCITHICSLIMLQSRTSFLANVIARQVAYVRLSQPLARRVSQLSQTSTLALKSQSRNFSIWHCTQTTLSSMSRRPSLKASQPQVSERSRGMKVRSSVKRLCDACKVGRNH